MRYGRDYFEKRKVTTTRSLTRSVYMNCLIFFSNCLSIRINNGNGKKALDVGCGYGYVLEILKEYGYDVFGIDISKHAIKKAKKINDDATLLVHDVQRPLPFKVKFDLITCFEVLEHLKNPQLAVRNFYESLKTGGLLLVSTPNKLSPFELYARILDKTHISVRSANEWRRIFNTYDWCKLSIFHRQYIPIIWWFTRKFKSFSFPFFGFSLLIGAQKGMMSNSQ
jgi:2-polyprenyl-3-methyl-5-hydroxy-6-metoxy-1,4-benzoquinol methylase